VADHTPPQQRWLLAYSPRASQCSQSQTISKNP